MSHFLLNDLMTVASRTTCSWSSSPIPVSEVAASWPTFSSTFDLIVQKRNGYSLGASIVLVIEISLKHHSRRSLGRPAGRKLSSWVQNACRCQEAHPSQSRKTYQILKSIRSRIPSLFKSVGQDAQHAPQNWQCWANLAKCWRQVGWSGTEENCQDGIPHLVVRKWCKYDRRLQFLQISNSRPGPSFDSCSLQLKICLVGVPGQVATYSNQL